MKSKLFIILCALASFNQVSCSMFTFENEFGDLLPSPTELTQMAVQETAQEIAAEAARTIKQLLERTAMQVASDKVRDIVHCIGNTALYTGIRSICTVENYDTYGRRALEFFGAAVSIYVALKGIEGLMGIEATIQKNASKNWGGPLPEEIEALLQAKKHYPALKERGVPPHNGYIFHGVPGTGKTLLARVVSDKLQIPLIETNAGKFMSMLQGSGNSKLKAIMNKARSCKTQKPFRCIVFID